jgi:hypothetical protein
MHVANRLKSPVLLWVMALLFGACATSTVTPTFPTSDTLVRPDRVLVYDFAATPTELEAKYGLDAQTSGGTGPQAQTQEEIRVGRTFAKALTDNLLQTLRSRGIDSYRAGESPPPGPNTASIKGRFMRPGRPDGPMVAGFGVADGLVHTNIEIYQGTGLNLQVVAQAEIATTSNLSPKLNSAPDATIEADARQTATQVADRIVDYYKRRGWIN